MFTVEEIIEMPETALEIAVDVLLTDCGYEEASDSVKGFLGLDEERYYRI